MQFINLSFISFYSLHTDNLQEQSFSHICRWLVSGRVENSEVFAAWEKK